MIEGLRAALDGATRVVVETDHVYRKVGKIVAVDVQRVEFTPDAVRAALAQPDARADVEHVLHLGSGTVVSSSCIFRGSTFDLRTRPREEAVSNQPEARAEELRLEGACHECGGVGPVVIVQCDTDPGDMGEPRLVHADDEVIVFVPSFDLWPEVE